MKSYIQVLLSITIAGGFLFLIYKFLPIGISLVITGACLATLTKTAQDKTTYYIGIIGSWIYPVGIMVTFIYSGWLLGLISIVIGIITYQAAKRK